MTEMQASNENDKPRSANTTLENSNTLTFFNHDVTVTHAFCCSITPLRYSLVGDRFQPVKPDNIWPNKRILISPYVVYLSCPTS